MLVRIHFEFLVEELLFKIRTLRSNARRSLRALFTGKLINKRWMSNYFTTPVADDDDNVHSFSNDFPLLGTGKNSEVHKKDDMTHSLKAQ